MSELRKKTIRLAHEKPHLRSVLLPLLVKEAKTKTVHEEQIDSAGELSKVDPDIAKIMVESGNAGSDKINVAKVKDIPASQLNPSQTTMVLGKSIGMALSMLKKGKIGGDLGAIISSDKQIMDGHHRWSAAILAAGNKAKVGGYVAKLKGQDLIKVLNVLTKGAFGVAQGKKGKGALKDYTPKKTKAMLEDFAKNGIGGDFPVSAESVSKILADTLGSGLKKKSGESEEDFFERKVQEGIKKMSENAKLINKTIPKWAPLRKDMPVIEPTQVPEAAQKMNEGKVDWTEEFKQASSLYKKTVRLAHEKPHLRKHLLPLLKNAAISEEPFSFTWVVQTMCETPTGWYESSQDHMSSRTKILQDKRVKNFLECLSLIEIASKKYIGRRYEDDDVGDLGIEKPISGDDFTPNKPKHPKMTWQNNYSQIEFLLQGNECVYLHTWSFGRGISEDVIKDFQDYFTFKNPKKIDWKDPADAATYRLENRHYLAHENRKATQQTWTELPYLKIPIAQMHPEDERELLDNLKKELRGYKVYMTGGMYGMGIKVQAAKPMSWEEFASKDLLRKAMNAIQKHREGWTPRSLNIRRFQRDNANFFKNL